jgi:hypothetical protein
LSLDENQFNIQIRARDYYSFFTMTLGVTGLLFQSPIGILTGQTADGVLESPVERHAPRGDDPAHGGALVVCDEKRSTRAVMTGTCTQIQRCLPCHGSQAAADPAGVAPRSLTPERTATELGASSDELSNSGSCGLADAILAGFTAAAALSRGGLSETARGVRS